MEKRLTIMGLGPGSFGSLSLDGLEAVKMADILLLRTEKHPLVSQLKELGINYQSFDHIYDESKEFDQVYALIAQQVIEACNNGRVVYAVPGHPMVGESTVPLITKKAREREIPVRFVTSISFLDNMFTALEIDPCDGIKVIDALQLSEQHKPSLDTGNLIMQVYNRLVAGDVKLSLMEMYPDNMRVWVVRAAGIPGEERKEEIPLYQLDRLDWLDYLTSLYVPPYPQGNKEYRYPLDALVEVMTQLRGEKGCPWDREQTHQSLLPYLLEEAYEVIEAIEEGTSEELADELGDLLLQVVFHAKLAEEQDKFDLNDVIDNIVDKMIRRHPHVFGNVKVANADEVLDNWASIKQQEKEDKGEEIKSSYLKEYPKQMPALLRAYKLQARAATIGFDWEEISQVWSKVEEESLELKKACQQRDKAEIEEELGDLLFAVVNLARFLDVHPELALERTIRKFMDRFHYIETSSEKLGIDLVDMTLNQMDQLWVEAKNTNKS